MMLSVRAFLAAARFQLELMRSNRDYWLVLVTTPFFAVIFLGITRHAGRDDLSAAAMLAPILIALWSMALFVAGEVIDTDRWYGTLESIVAAPVGLTILVLGRVAAVTAVSLLSVGEVFLVGQLGFGVRVVPHHPGPFMLALLATGLAMTGTSVAMAGLFVTTRTARTFQNSSSFPFYVLGGVLVPVSFLPGWLQPVSKLVFLSWSADLLRDSLGPAPVDQVPLRLGAIAALGVAGFMLGHYLIERLLWRVRGLGSLSYK
jgi:ABC-2 type transport system permease protein